MQTDAPPQIDSVDQFTELMKRFGALPRTSPRPTFMDVAGYPHYENVCSNILAFYLNPGEAHGLGDLVLRSLLQILEFPDASLGQTLVEREYMTSHGGRLDLLVDTDAVTIGIEHKVYAGVYNDLDDYAKSIDHSATQPNQPKKKAFKVVLSVKPACANELRPGWQNITHGQLWRVVRSLLGNYAADAELKWLTYLLEFMQSMANLGGENMELKAIEQFVVENSDAIDHLIAVRQALFQKLRDRLPELQEILSSALEGGKLDQPPYRYSTDRIVLDMAKCLPNSKPVDPPMIAFDLFVTTKGWDLQMFGRDTDGGHYWQELIRRAPLQARLADAKSMLQGRRLSVQQWPVTADLAQMAADVVSWVEATHQAAAD